MRFLLLSDIHANLTALEASLDAAKGRWERIFCLGDIVDYGPDPNEVTERVKELAERYETPLPALTSLVAEREAKVNGHLERMGVSWT